MESEISEDVDSHANSDSSDFFDAEGGSHKADQETDGDDEMTEEGIWTKKIYTKKQIKEVWIRLTAARKDKQHASDVISEVKEEYAYLQKAKKAFCSLRRSEV